MVGGRDAGREGADRRAGSRRERPVWHCATFVGNSGGEGGGWVPLALWPPPTGVTGADGPSRHLHHLSFDLLVAAGGLGVATRTCSPRLALPSLPNPLTLDAACRERLHRLKETHCVADGRARVCLQSCHGVGVWGSRLRYSLFSSTHPSNVPPWPAACSPRWHAATDAVSAAPCVSCRQVRGRGRLPGRGRRRSGGSRGGGRRWAR